MMRLILFRHAKAERRAVSGEDFDRRLTDRGRTDAVLMGEALRDLGMAPDLALVSAAARTTGTWDAMTGAFPEARADIRPELYDADAATLLAAAKDAGAAGTVMIVAHNPGLHEAAFTLARGGQAEAEAMSGLRAGMPTATAGVFDLTGAAPRLEAWLTARAFGGGAGE